MAQDSPYDTLDVSEPRLNSLCSWERFADAVITVSLEDVRNPPVIVVVL